MHACFSPYMLISSTLQLVFGYDRRGQQQLTADKNEQLQIELRKAREEFQDMQEAQKIADMRAKMAIARKYRCEEKFEQTRLQDMSTELKAFFETCLPISQTSIPILLDYAEQYKKANYDSSCPLNVILLHTCQKLINYNDIQDRLEKTQEPLGNIVYRRWCDKNVAHNASLMNLHAIMGNIPTLVISPFFCNGKIHFTVSMWEAQSEVQPLIRPLFSIDCNRVELKNQEYKKQIQNKISIISILISGVARDTYMLMTQGLAPTFPLCVKNDSEVSAFLKNSDNKEITNFILSEYMTAVELLTEKGSASGLLSKEQMALLGAQAEKASNQLSEYSNSSK